MTKIMKQNYIIKMQWTKCGKYKREKWYAKREKKKKDKRKNMNGCLK